MEQNIKELLYDLCVHLDNSDLTRALQSLRDLQEILESESAYK